MRNIQMLGVGIVHLDKKFMFEIMERFMHFIKVSKKLLAFSTIVFLVFNTSNASTQETSPNIGIQCLTRHGTTTDQSPNHLNKQGEWYASILPNIINSQCMGGVLYDISWDWIYDTIEPTAKAISPNNSPSGYPWSASNPMLERKFKEVMSRNSGNEHFLWGTSKVHDLDPILDWYTESKISSLSSDQAYGYYYELNVKNRSTATITAVPSGQLHEFVNYESVVKTPRESHSSWAVPAPESLIWFFNKSKDGDFQMIVRDRNFKTLIPSDFEHASPISITDYQYFKDISMPSEVSQGWESAFFSSTQNRTLLIFLGVGSNSNKKSWFYNLNNGSWCQEGQGCFTLPARRPSSAFSWPQNGNKRFYRIYAAENQYCIGSGESRECHELSAWPGLADQFQNGFDAFFLPINGLLGDKLLFVFNTEYFQAFEQDGTPKYVNAEGEPSYIFGNFPGMADREVIWTGTPKTD